MGEILISQEYIQVEYSTIRKILISNEFIQVEYIPGPSGLGNLNAEINAGIIGPANLKSVAGVLKIDIKSIGKILIENIKKTCTID